MPARATSISGRFDDNDIELGGRATLRIAVAPAAKGVEVALERRSGSRWVRERSGPTRADGTIAWSLTPATAGTYAYRLTSGGTASPTVYLKVTDRVHLGCASVRGAASSSGRAVTPSRPPPTTGPWAAAPARSAR